MNKRVRHKPSQHAYIAKSLVAALLLALASFAAGQAIPGAGTILQQAEPVKPAAPSAPSTPLMIEQESSGKLPPGAPFLMKRIEISGNTAFDTATLHALVANAEGTDITLAQLEQLAARITDYYRSHGFPLARALIPAQTISTGTVRMQIIEARYGKTTLDNRSLVDDALLSATLSPLKGDQAIAQTELDRVLLLLSDIPGASVNATLKPGAVVATSDLLVNVTPRPAVVSSVVLDTYGNNYTGRVRAGATVSWNNPLHHGDVLSASGLSSGRGMAYGRLGYDTLLNGYGTRLGGSYSALRYELGEALAPLDAHGGAQVASLWARHPLLRSRDVNLYGQVQFDRLQLRDHVDVIAFKMDRHLANWTVSLAGDMRDSFLAGGISAWNVGWTMGQIGFDDATAQAIDAATSRTQGRFSKWNSSLVRLQNLSPATALYLSIMGQWANTNLDASQKMVEGGAYTVRAYDMSALSGDTGYLATVELRHELGFAWQGQWQVLAFVDSAHVTVNHSPWAVGQNSATLSGAGVGLNWIGPNLWSSRLYLAAPIGARPALVSDTASVRAWLTIGKGF